MSAEKPEKISQTKVELKVSKVIEELDSTEDVLEEPRSWSPKDLKQVCMNVDIESINAEQVLALDEAVVHYLIKNFFFIQHQTGLYNPQKDLWSSIARTKKVRIKPIKSPFWVAKDKYKLTDIYFYEEQKTSKFLKVRIAHEQADDIEAPGFDSFISNLSSNCTGAIYISKKPYSEKFIKKVQAKTNHKDFFDRYRSPVGKSSSLNLIQCIEHEANSKFEFVLVHPDLERKISSTICFQH